MSKFQYRNTFSDFSSFGEIKCWVGFHKWEYADCSGRIVYPFNENINVRDRTCLKCGKKQRRLPSEYTRSLIPLNFTWQTIEP